MINTWSISWKKTTGGAYQARIDGPRILHITALSVRDSKGLTQSTQIPDRPDSGRTEAPEENKSADPAQPIPESKPEDPSIKEEHFKGLPTVRKMGREIRNLRKSK